MIIGKYAKGGADMPRVAHISVARYQRSLPRPGQPLEFLVSFHEEGMGVTFQQNVVLHPDDEQKMLKAVDELYLWSLNAGGTLESTMQKVELLARGLAQVFLGKTGHEVLERIQPTAILLDVDETILNLPWELLTFPGGLIASYIPFGRLVTARALPRRGRDPRSDDAVVRVLVIADPEENLGAAQPTQEILKEIQAPAPVEVDVLSGKEATLACFKERLAGGDYDIIHFDGHAKMDHRRPGSSGMVFSDGVLTANDILDLPWKEPPYLIFNSSCESGRAAGGLRLVSRARQASGLPSAFLAAGIYIYVGFYWPVTTTGAGLFAKAFYESLFRHVNIGIAFLEARNQARNELADFGDLTGFSAILFGDSGGDARLSIAQAA